MSRKFIFFVILGFTVLIVLFTQNIIVNKTSPKITSKITILNTPINQQLKPSKDQNNLSNVVVQICHLVENMDIGRLKLWVVEVPGIYTQKSRDLMRKNLKMDEKKFQQVTKAQKGKFTVDSYPISANKEELVYNAIPAIKLIQKQQRKFKGIVDLKQNENEAKAIVTFGNEEFQGLKYEILLIRGDDGWKTFSFTFPNNWSTTYAEKTFD